MSKELNSTKMSIQALRSGLRALADYIGPKCRNAVEVAMASVSLDAHQDELLAHDPERCIACGGNHGNIGLPCPNMRVTAQHTVHSHTCGLDMPTGNQCDGCQAGIPVDPKGIHRMNQAGGYSDLMACQAHSYEHHPKQAEGAQGDACDWLESLEGDAWADACEEIAAAIGQPEPVVQESLPVQFVNSVKRLCKDFSDRQDRPYMADVYNALDALLEHEQIPVALPERVAISQREREAFEAHEAKVRRLSPADQQFWFRRGAIADYDLKSIDDAWKAWKARAALAQASPAPELERPEAIIIAYLQVDGWAKQAEREGRAAEAENYRRLAATINSARADYDRIVGALLAEVERWHEASDEAMQLNIKSRKELRAAIRERDAAQSRLAEMEKQEPFCLMYRIFGEPVVQLVGDPHIKDGMALYAAPVAQAGQVPDIDSMVSRFLAWPLPANVCADLCATMPGEPYRTGTNLLTATQAKAMLEHMLAAAPQPAGGADHE